MLKVQRIVNTATFNRHNAIIGSMMFGLDEAMNHHECGTTKVCKKCGEDKPITEYRVHNVKNRKPWTDGKCKQCVRDWHKVYAESNRDTVRGYSKKTYARNAETVNERTKAYYHANKERYAELRKANAAANPERERARANEWRRRNLDKNLAAVMKRYAVKKQAVPGWFNQAEVNAIYAASAEKTKVTGIKHNVDHIVPLNSPVVCGLHCTDNLRVITQEENFRKSNKIVDDIC